MAALLGLAGLAFPVSAQLTGPEVPEMAHYDTDLAALFDQYDIPGAAVAVTKDGRLVYARGFGQSDVEANVAVQPDARFRIASISKPITSVAVMRLVEEGALGLDDPAFAYLPDLPAPEGQTEDPRLSQITIRDLLQHSGGWDPNVSGYDPTFMDIVGIAEAMDVPPPADIETIVRYMRGQPLDFTPGDRFAYSSFGYAVLGRIIERVTESSYEDYVLGLLAETGISQMALGRSLLEDRLPGEVRYYEYNGLMVPSMFPPFVAVPWPYGGFYMEAMGANGGWVTSAPDLLRFIEAVDGRPGRPDILSAASVQTMTARPDLSTWPAGSASWYALGWLANVNGHWWHSGSLPGTATLLVRANYRGLAWTVLCNTRPHPDNGFYAALDNTMWDAAIATTTWPTHDFFDQLVDAESEAAPSDVFALSHPTPNPAHGTTAFEVTLPLAQSVRVAVYDLLGREVAVLHDGPMSAATHRLTFGGHGLGSGVYVVRAVSGTTVATRRMTLVR